MNRRQKIIVAKFIAIIVITAISAFAMIIVKEQINRSEALRAMNLLSDRLLKYKDTYGALPPETYLDTILGDIPGNLRLGKLKYRAIWITLESGPEEIIAYSEREFRSISTTKGFIVRRLKGDAEWMERKKFIALLESQQSQMEKLSLH